jgi:hypothetical protein
MDVKLALIAYFLLGLAVVLGISMAFGLVPPNRFYGYNGKGWAALAASGKQADRSWLA